MLPKYPIKAQNATNTESTDVAVFIVPDGAISGNEVDISAGGGVAIGDTITDATEGSVLFAGAAGVLAQNNTAFKWVNADTQLQLTAGGATKTPLYVKLAGSQTADAFQVYASDGTTKLTSIASTGALTLPGLGIFPSNASIKFTNGLNIQAASDGNSLWFGFTDWTPLGFTLNGGMAGPQLLMAGTGQFCFESGGNAYDNPADIGIARIGAGILKITNGSTGAGCLELLEQTAPSAATANSVRIFAQDNGAGKTQLMALFATGVAQQIAIEP